MITQYKTIGEKTEALIREKASKFFGLVYPVANEEEIKSILDDLHKRYYDATHVCYAYVLGADKMKFRANDDGEPANTAGKPILGQIHHYDLTNVLVAVVRYYGGTKLGVGGLIQAYKDAAHAALEQTIVLVKEVTLRMELHCSYDLLGNVLREIKKCKGEIISNHQDEQNHLVFDLPVDQESIFLHNIESLLIQCKRYE